MDKEQKRQRQHKHYTAFLHTKNPPLVASILVSSIAPPPFAIRFAHCSFMSSPSDYGPPSSTVTLDYDGDEKLKTTPGGFVTLISRDGVWDLIELGYQYARLKSKRGDFKSFELT